MRGVDLLAPGVDAATQGAGLSEAMAGKVGRGIHASGPLVIDEDGERGAVPAGRGFPA